MKGQLYGLHISGENGMENCAALSKRQLTELFDSGINYDGFAYPYFDSVLMSDAFERYGLPFGTHALIWDADGRLSDSDARPLGFDYRNILDFLESGMYQPSENEVLIGGYEQIITGAAQPWAIREHSRKFCSFCEHIARMTGVKLKGLTGGYVVAELENDAIIEKISEIYNAKTGGICRILRYGAAGQEEK